jgi:hypothetical protein
VLFNICLIILNVTRNLSPTEIEGLLVALWKRHVSDPFCWDNVMVRAGIRVAVVFLLPSTIIRCSIYSLHPSNVRINYQVLVESGVIPTQMNTPLAHLLRKPWKILAL